MPGTKKTTQSTGKATAKTTKKTAVGKVKTKIGIKTVNNALTMRIYDVRGEESTPVELPKEIFGAKVNERLLAQAIRVYQINQRQGTASTKSRGQVIGSTRKIYKQKGTGKARHGDIKAPIFVGGGVVGGPKPRNFAAKINKKQKKLALTYALTIKAKSGDISGLTKDFEKIEPKTKKMADFFRKINIENKKTLFIVPTVKKDNFILAVRNIPKVSVVGVMSINPFILLNSHKIFFREDTLEILGKYLRNEN